MNLQFHLLERVNDALLSINGRDVLATADNISMRVHYKLCYAIDLLSEINEELD